MADRVANIGDHGARRRGRTGIVWLVIAIAASVVLVLTDTPRYCRLALIVPFGFAVNGLLQAREKT